MAMCVKIAIVLYEFANEETASCVNYCWKIKQYYTVGQKIEKGPEKFNFTKKNT